MPHCIVEYSDEVAQKINISELLILVQDAVFSSGLFTASHIKTRAIAYEHFSIMSDKKNFICTTIKLLSGRSDEQKLDLSNKVLAVIKQLSPASTVLSVEIVDMDKKTYSKATL